MIVKDFGCEENKNRVVVGNPILVGTEYEMEMAECPHCHGMFAVDATYLDQVDEIVHCPMCCMQVELAESQEYIATPQQGAEDESID